MVKVNSTYPQYFIQINIYPLIADWQRMKRHFLYFLLHRLYLYFVHSPIWIRPKIIPDQTEVERLNSLVDLLLQTGPDVDVLPDDGCPGTELIWHCLSISIYSDYTSLNQNGFYQRSPNTNQPLKASQLSVSFQFKLAIIHFAGDEWPI